MAFYDSFLNNRYTQAFINSIPAQAVMSSWFMGWAFSTFTNEQINTYNANNIAEDPDTTRRSSLQINISILSIMILNGATALLSKFVRVSNPLVAFISLILLGLPFILHNYNSIDIANGHRDNNPTRNQNPSYFQKATNFLNNYYPHMLTLSSLFYAGVFLYSGSLMIPALMVGSLTLGSLKRHNLLPHFLTDSVERYSNVLANLALVITGPLYAKVYSSYILFSKLSLSFANRIRMNILKVLFGWIPIPYFQKYFKAYTIGSAIHEVAPFELRGNINTETDFRDFLDAVSDLPNNEHLARLKPSRAFVQNYKAADLLPPINENIQLSTLYDLFRLHIYEPYLLKTREQAEIDVVISLIMNRLRDDWQSSSATINIESHETRLRNKIDELYPNDIARANALFRDLKQHLPNNNAILDSKLFWMNQINAMQDQNIAATLMEKLNHGFDPIEYVLLRITILIDTVQTGNLPTIPVGKRIQVLHMLSATIGAISELSKDLTDPDKVNLFNKLLIDLAVEAGKYCPDGVTAAIERSYKLAIPFLPVEYKLSSNKHMALALAPDRENFFVSYFENKLSRLPVWIRNYMRSNLLVNIHGRNELIENAPRLYPNFSAESGRPTYEADVLHNSGFSNMPPLPGIFFPWITHQNVEYSYWSQVTTDSLLNDIQEKFLNNELTTDGFFTPWLKELIQNSNCFNNKEVCLDLLSDAELFEKMVVYIQENRVLKPRLSRGFLILLALHTGVLFIDNVDNHLTFENSTLRFGMGEDWRSLNETINPSNALSWYARFKNFLKSFIKPTTQPIRKTKEEEEEKLNEVKSDDVKTAKNNKYLQDPSENSPYLFDFSRSHASNSSGDDSKRKSKHEKTLKRRKKPAHS